MNVKRFEVGKTYTCKTTGATVTIMRRTAKMCYIETRHACGLVDAAGTGMRKIKLSFTNDENFDRIEMLEPWGRFCYSVFAK